MINITKRGWQHILKHHTGTPSSKRAKKSTFNHGVDLIQLINQASLHQPIGKVRRHLVRVFDAGHIIGIDCNNGKLTSIVMY